MTQPSFFLRLYNSTLNSEIETNLRLAANQNQPNDHEGFFIKLISVGLVAYVYDIAWAYIYKSQMLLLMELNRRMMPLLEVRPYYDTAAEAYPAVYKNYSFEQWLNWIKASYLIIQHPSNMVEITARGRDFLKYLVHLGRYVDDKTC